MPIRTRMKKSGRKRVYDQDAEGWRGPLNQAAREVFQGGNPNLTPGVAGLTDPLKKRQTERSQAVIIQNRRRRKLASLHKLNTGLR